MSTSTGRGPALVLLAVLAAPKAAAAEPAPRPEPPAPEPAARSSAAPVREWVEVGHGIRFGVGTTALDVSPRAPRIVYLGTDVGFVFRSIDGGVTWDEVRLLPDDVPQLDVPVMDAFAIPFPNEGLVDTYFAQPPRTTFGPGLTFRGPNPYDHLGVDAASGRFGFPGSRVSWPAASEASHAGSYALGGSGARVEVEDPGNLMALYFRGIAAQPGRVNWISICPTDPTVAFAATNFGAFRTMDMGLTWDRVFIGSSDGENQVRCVHCHPEDSRTVYLATAEGMRTTRDGGESWRRATGNFGVWPVGFVSTHPLDRRRIVVGTDLGAYETVTGAEYQEIYLADTPSPDVRIVSVVRPTTDERVTYVGTFDGAAYTHDGGRSWHRMGEFLIGHYRVRAIMVAPDDPMHVYVVTDWHVFESRDGGASLVEMWPAYTGLKYAMLDPEDPGDIWLVGYSQVWRYEDPRPEPRGAPSPMVSRARRALARDPGPYAVEDAALGRARLDTASITAYRRAIRRSALVPTLDLVGWGFAVSGSLGTRGTGRPAMLSPYYALSCRRRMVPNVCEWASPLLPLDTRDEWRVPQLGALFVLSWPFGRAVMDERAAGRLWSDVFAMRNNVMYTVYDYWADRRRLLEYVASGRASAEEERAFALRLEEMSAVLDGMTNGAVGGPFGELDRWEVD